MRYKNGGASMAALAATLMALLQSVSGPAAAGSFGAPQDISDITAIENEMARETDIDKVMAYFADNAVLIDIAAPGWYEGRQQIRAAVQPQLAALQAIKYRMDEISVASDGSFACAAMQIHFDATKKDNSLMKMSLRQVDAFKKIDGHWRIIQQHFSLPVDQKTAVPIPDAAVTSQGTMAWSDSSALGPRVPVAKAKEEISAWLTASETPKNIDEMRTYYGPGDDFMIFDWWSPREVRGTAQMREYYGPQFDGVRDMQIKIPVVRVDSDGAFGVEASQQQLKMNMQNGSSQIISFRQSDCVRRVGNRWYSFFEMGSFPVDPKTNKAIMTAPDTFK